MALLSHLRRELRFNVEFYQLIQTLKSIAASQYHMLEREKQRFEEFMNAFAGFFRIVDMVGVDHPLVRPLSPVLGMVIVTSDSGFMGGLNGAVIEAALDAQGALGDDQVQLIVIGEKGAVRVMEKGRAFKFFRGIQEETRYEQALEIRDYLVGEVLAQRIGKVLVAYPRPLSFTQQRVEVIKLLPCAELFDPGAVSAVSERLPRLPLLAEMRKVIVESRFSDMVEYLSSVWVGSRLYEVFEDSKLSEYAARAMHLEESGHKLEKELAKLRHQCFRAAHELVDKGMRESYAARKKGRRKVA